MKKLFTTIVLLLFSLFATALADEIQIFSPTPNETVLKTDVLIAASFFDLGGVSTDRVNLFLDDVNITDRAEIDTDMLSYTPALMSPGAHTVRILILRDGQDPLEKEWSFIVAGQKKWTDELDWSGKVTSGYRVDQLNTSELQVGQVGVSLRGSAFEWLRFKTNLKLATDEDPLIQPRNRYTFQMSFSRYLDLNFGDVNPRVSRFTIDGKRIRGFEANLKLNIINFHYLKGDLLRDIDGSLAEDASYSISRIALENDTTRVELNRKGYTFRQELNGGRLSFGSGRYFQLGFSFMKIKDDINSITPIMDNAKVVVGENLFGLASSVYTIDELLATTLNDSGYVNDIQLAKGTDWSGATPQDNIVLGSDMGMYLDNKRFFLEGEFAFSMYNSDIWDGARSKIELDTLLGDSLDGLLMGSVNLDLLPFDPVDVAGIFVINENMIPLVPLDTRPFTGNDTSGVSKMEAILNMASLAYRGRAKLQYFGHYLTLEFSHIGEGFKSLANPYLISGIEEFVIGDRIQMLKNRVMLSVEYRRQSDDVSTAIANVTIQNRFITNLTVIPGPGLPTISVGYRMNDLNNGITALDTLVNAVTNEISFADNRNFTKTQNITASVNYVFDAYDSRHTIFGTYVIYDKEDQYADRGADSTFIDPGITSKVFNLTTNSRFGFIPLKTTMSVTTNKSNFNIGPGVSSIQAFTTAKIDAEYGFFNQKIAVLAGINYMKGEGAQDILRVGFLGGVKFRLIEDLMAHATVDVRQKSIAGETSVEYIGVAGLSYIF